MFFVAVDQDELAGPGMAGTALKGQIQFPFLNIHQKKAVEGFPGEGVPWQIGEQPALQRVEKGLLRHTAGRVNEIVGYGSDKLFAGFHKDHLREIFRTGLRQ